MRVLKFRTPNLDKGLTRTEGRSVTQITIIVSVHFKKHGRKVSNNKV